MNNDFRILLSAPDVGDVERAALLAAFDSNWISTVGPAIADFENAMTERIGRPCVAVSSGTAGLHLALRLAGVRPGDSVLCQSFTFVASANPILYEKAVPTFLDSETRTWNIDPNALEDAIKSHARRGRVPRALIVVHLYGMPAEIENIRTICEHHGIALVEDAAESLGSTVHHRETGIFGQSGVFSFNGNKIITTAGGGMVAVSSESDAVRVRKWSTQSRDAATCYEHSELGFNYRMSNLLAALGSAQLRQLPEKIRRRREIFIKYERTITDLGGISFQPEAAGSRSNRWLSAMWINPEIWPGKRDALISHLAAKGIETRPLWKPMHLQPLFQGAPYFGSGVCETLFRSGLCLPSSSALSQEQQEDIIQAIRDFFLSQSGQPAASPRSLATFPQFNDHSSTSPVLLGD
jgi:dTDP-4-amino-4,6-dideoxygalactose transaminase